MIPHWPSQAERDRDAAQRAAAHAKATKPVADPPAADDVRAHVRVEKVGGEIKGLDEALQVAFAKGADWGAAKVRAELSHPALASLDKSAHPAATEPVKYGDAVLTHLKKVKGANS